ncbi:DEAD/DEAH box helicase [Aeromonas rivuli]|uniref:DEAD/DEAH box helicase n=1 Tax=Aeromonas TaxID=642 RepID=UPI0005A6C9C5|nr:MULTISPECIES: DEAD/DEAH box helicase [Aeromonas]MCS3453973.1 ATP-dependent RNA helicase RhlE [Aeromonas sp. BIGb0405]MCS3459852.1 ATP-dependent RNA helicase RhlE [Aeromonas sp. BIGb0445]
MSFNELGLSPHILRAVKELGYAQPTPIQQQAIPAILAGQDVLGGAQTGTGKTAGFTLPMLHRLLANHGRGGRRQVRALILTPTRELAAQVGESIIKYANHLPFRTLIAYGGVSIKPNLEAIKLGVDILVATPGRLLDLLTQRALTLTELEVLVLDEADRMLDMGFITDIRRIMKALPEERQTLLFSATFSDEIKALADDLLKSPTLIEVSPSNSTAEQVNQRVIKVDRERKRELLSHMIGRGNWQRVLVFVRTKLIADRLAQQMVKDGLNTVAIHGDKTQGARNRALADFREGKVRVLVATDIAARGLDIDLLPHVINFELPQVAEDYIHRIGRTGRAGRGGEAISLVSLDELDQLKAIESLIGQSIPSEIQEGYEPSGKVTRQSLPSNKPIQNRDRGGHVNAKHNVKAREKAAKEQPAARGKPATKPKPKAVGSKAAAPARQKERGGEDTGFAPMRRLPKTQRDGYQDNSNEE